MSTVVKKEIKEVVIELDSTLEVIVPWYMQEPKDENQREQFDRAKESYKERDLEAPKRFNDKLIGKSTKGKDSLTTVRDCIKGEFRHLGYLDYLQTAWNNHYGIVFTPDIFWQLFLSEIATHIKDNAENYRSLFTDSDEKKEILVPTGDLELIDLRLIAAELLKLTPTNTEMFLPEFTTTTFEASMAFKAAFADAMSPYYSYGMFCCGIPNVKLLGEEKDWDTVTENIEALGEIIALPDYFTKITELAKNIKSNISKPDADFWKGIFTLTPCGSGSQVEVSGWITDFFITAKPGEFINNYPSPVSYVSYKNITTNKKFELCYGLFSSNIEDGYLTPEFGFIINEEK